jgi:thiol-disulfide isomerase/thioredoxin
MKFVSVGPNDAPLFDKLVKNKPAFVKFYSPFCVHCNEMAPAWNSLKGLQKKVNIIEVHHDAINNIKSDCARNIVGFPTIMIVTAGGKSGREYHGPRDTKSMLKFINARFKPRKQTQKKNKEMVLKNRGRKNSRRAKKIYRHSLE